MYDKNVEFSVEFPVLTVNIQSPRVLLGAATDVSVLSTARQGLPRIFHLRGETQCAGTNISVRACLKHHRESNSNLHIQCFKRCNRIPCNMAGHKGLLYHRYVITFIGF